MVTSGPSGPYVKIGTMQRKIRLKWLQWGVIWSIGCDCSRPATKRSIRSERFIRFTKEGFSQKVRLLALVAEREKV